MENVFDAIFPRYTSSTSTVEVPPRGAITSDRTTRPRTITPLELIRSDSLVSAKLEIASFPPATTIRSRTTTTETYLLAAWQIFIPSRPCVIVHGRVEPDAVARSSTICGEGRTFARTDSRFTTSPAVLISSSVRLHHPPSVTGQMISDPWAAKHLQDSRVHNSVNG